MNLDLFDWWYLNTPQSLQEFSGWVKFKPGLSDKSEVSFNLIDFHCSDIKKLSKQVG